MFGKAIGGSAVALPAVWPVSALAAWSPPCGVWVGGRGGVHVGGGCFCAPGSAYPGPAAAPGGGPCPLRLCAGGAAGGAGKGCSPPTAACVVSALFPVIFGPVSRTPGTAVPGVSVSLCPGRRTACSPFLMRLILMISFLLLTLGFFCFSFCNCFRCKVR